MKLKDATLTQLLEQKKQLIDNSDNEWKQTVFYKNRMDEIERCISLKR